MRLLLLLIVSPFLVDVSAHIDKPCNFLGCLNNILQPVENVYCDEQNICRCRPGFFKITDHQCLKPQPHGAFCKKDIVCELTDKNMFCGGPYRLEKCECRAGFFYDRATKICAKIQRIGKGAPMFPLMAVIFIACIGIFCGCGLICHNFRSQPELSRSVNQAQRRRAFPSNATGGGQRNSRPSTSDGNANDRAESRASSKYDSLMYDEPPPNYEDAIKDFPQEATIVQTITVVPNIPLQPFLQPPAKVV